MNQTPRIFCINGPAGSGKDTLGEIIRDLLTKPTYSPVMDKFAAPIEEALHGLLKETDYGYKFRRWRHDPMRKEQEFIWGMTIRELMIKFSEEFIKPVAGNDAFAQLAVERAIKTHLHYDAPMDEYIIYTDTGFQSEFDAYCRALKSTWPNAEINLIQIHRTGHTFEGDSREWVIANDQTDNIHRIVNDGSLDDLPEIGLEIVGLEACGL